MCHGRKLDGPEALMTEARRAGLDAQRFRIDLESNAILEAFASDLEETRTIPTPPVRPAWPRRAATAPNVERLAFPALRLIPDGDAAGERWVGGDHSYDDWRAAAIAAGATPLDGPRPDVAAALQRFGSMATAELEAVCDLPGRVPGRSVAPGERMAGTPRAGPQLRLWEPA